MIRITTFTALALVLAGGTSFAQVTDPNMTCADYLKLEASAGPTPSTGDAATDKMAVDIDKKPISTRR